MKAILRIVLGLGALLVLMVVALGSYLAFFFEPNDYRERLAGLVFERTGRQLELSGELELSVFPWLGFRIGRAELGNAPGFSQRPFITLASAQARVKLMPLLKNEIAVDRVVLKGLQLSLERRADGRSNWDDLGAGRAEGDDQHGGGGGGAGGGAAALGIGGVVIEDAVVVWDDARAGVSHTFNDIDIDIGAIAPGQPFDFEAAASFAATRPALEGRFSIGGRATLDVSAQRHEVSGLLASLKAQGNVPGGALDATLAGDVGVDLGRGTVSLEALSLKAYGVALSGALEGSGVPAAPVFKGTLTLEEFSPRVLMNRLGMPEPGTANADRLGHAAARMNVDASAKRIAFEDVNLTLDESTLSGRFEIADLARQALRFDLSLDALDVDSYLPAPPPQARSGTGAGAGAVSSGEGADAAASPPPSVDGLRGLDLAGRLRVGTLRIARLQVGAIDVGVKAAGGRLELTPKAALYEGKLDSRLSLDARPRTPRVAASGSLSDVQIGLLLRDLTGQPEKLTGRARVGFDLSGAGLAAARLKPSLVGTVKLEALDGAIKGINVARYLREAQAKLSGKPVPEENEPNQTDFSDLNATLKLGDGIVSNDDLALRSPLLRVGGDGTADLVRERIDYRLRASLVGTLTGQDGKPLDKVKAVTVPIKVTGSFTDPKYALDVDALLSGAAGQKVDAAREKAKDKVEEKLEKGLRGLFK
jgi:AsmA protein